MKYLQISFITCLTVMFLFTSCSKDTPPKEDLMEPQEEAPVVQKLSRIAYETGDYQRFYYDGDQLIESQVDIFIYDEVNDTTKLVTSHSYYEYENDKLVRVVNGSRTTNFTYQGDDLIMSDFHTQQADATMTFKNYKDQSSFRIEYYLQAGFEPEFDTEFDDNGNFLFGEDDNGNELYVSYPGFNDLRNYYGEFSYNDKNHFAKDFDLEVQLYLFRIPYNNSISSSIQHNKIIEYEYEFDENQYPITRTPLWIYPDTTVVFKTVSYFYE